MLRWGEGFPRHMGRKESAKTSSPHAIFGAPQPVLTHTCDALHLSHMRDAHEAADESDAHEPQHIPPQVANKGGLGCLAGRSTLEESSGKQGSRGGME